ncbi:MAG: Hsp20/alpha crystallin family protein [Ruminococcus sp.]|nr:Hsp20/alpha crystallin family protein [Ruminococcus sp.]
MFALTPFERRGYDLFDAFRGFDDDFFKAPQMRSFRTDIKDEGDKFVMEAELPGFDKEDIKLDITGDTLTLSAEHKAEKKEENKKDNYIRRERTYGSYQRSFDLTGIDADKIEAEYKNGILELTLPKMAEVKPESRRLEIK